jgi:hypothetical protein
MQIFDEIGCKLLEELNTPLYYIYSSMYTVTSNYSYLHVSNRLITVCISTMHLEYLRQLKTPKCRPAGQLTTASRGSPYRGVATPHPRPYRSLNEEYRRCRVVLPPSNKCCNYGIRISQTNSSLTKFIVNSINIYVFK